MESWSYFHRKEILSIQCDSYTAMVYCKCRLHSLGKERRRYSLHHHIPFYILKVLNKFINAWVFTKAI